MGDVILDSLNEQQREAVVFGGRHLLVCAGPGTGKTRVITHRIAYLVERMGIDPETILAITFTNKAAGEMRGRVDRLLGSSVQARPWMGTFHAFAHWLLRRHWQEANVPKGFTIFDRDDQKSLMREILTAHEIPSAKAGVFLDVIQGLKDDLMDAKSYAIHTDVASDPYRASVAKIYAAYQEALRKQNGLDFGCLLLEGHNLLRDHAEVTDIYRKRFNYVFIDEYQDTNRAQYAMAKLLTGDSNSFTCVGDEDQLIYRWRGADPRNILNFEQEFKGAGCVILSQNYRSTPNILSAAKKLIEKNEMRKTKDLTARREAGQDIEVSLAADDREEARTTAQKVTDLIAQGISPSEIAVFYRINAQSRNFEIEFKMNRIPFRLIGAVGFYARREVKDLLAMARVLVNPKDETSLWRVLANFSEFSITEDAMEKIKNAAQAQNVPVWEALWSQSRPETSALSKRAQGKLARFLEVHHLLSEKRQGAETGAYLEMIAENTGLFQALEIEEDRVLNIWELIESAKGFDEANPGAGLSEFLNHASLMASTAMDNDSGQKRGPLEGAVPAPAVSLMTVHLAKGLEFHSVFVTGLEEGLFPFKNSKSNPEELEEERRLFYVAMTRAKDGLHLSRARRRVLFGSETRAQSSRFLFEAGLLSGTFDATPSLRRGVRVKHPLFGVGRVLSIAGSGKDAKITVHFTEGSTRKFLAGLAPLEVVG